MNIFFCWKITEMVEGRNYLELNIKSVDWKTRCSWKTLVDRQIALGGISSNRRANGYWRSATIRLWKVILFQSHSELLCNSVSEDKEKGAIIDNIGIYDQSRRPNQSSHHMIQLIVTKGAVQIRKAFLFLLIKLVENCHPRNN